MNHDICASDDQNLRSPAWGGEGLRSRGSRTTRAGAGHLLQASQRASQEGLRALRLLRRRGGAHRLLQQGPPLRVLKQQVRGCASIDL